MAQGLDRPLAQSAPPGYRYWEDFGLAVNLFRGDPVRALPASSTSATDFEAARAEIARLDIKPWQFWRTAAEDAFPGADPARGMRAFEDVGRARLIALFFRLRAGIAPFAPFWPAVLLALPLLVWTGVEMSRAGHPLAAALFVFAVASSAFVVDVLPLAYSTTGFYLVGLLMVVPWSVYALSSSWTERGLLARAAIGGAALGLCVFCRTTTLLVLPGFLAAAALAAWRARPRSRAGMIVLAAAVLVVPPIVTRAAAGGHDVWISLWEGLGDFDRSKGHVWSDAAAKRAVRAQGVEDLRSPEAQVFFRADVIGSIRSDPRWYAAILARRALATLAQWKLWGSGIRPSTDPAEGAMDGYFGLARTVDVFTLARHDLEVPVPLLLTGPVLLGLIAIRRVRQGEPAPEAWTVACVLAGALGVPVILSIAGAVEAQAPALAWLLAWAFVAERAWSVVSDRRTRG